MRCLLLLLTALCNISFADTVTGQSTNGINQYNLTCDAQANCVFTIQNNHSKVTFQRDGLAVIDRTNLIWQSNNLLELRSGFGTGLAYSYFADFKSLSLSDQFLNADFIDPINEIAIVQDLSNSDKYLMICIFNDKVAPKVILSNAVLDVGSYQTINTNQVKFGYYDSNSNYAYKTVALDLNCN